MDAPPIQYCQTVDGVNIAYWTLGDGPPLLYVNTPLWSHAELIWHLSAFREFLSGIGRGRRLIYFDPRSCGLSDGTPPTSFHAWQPDVSAVLDAAGVARTSIVGAELATKAAVIFAAQHPERVDGMVLWSGSAEPPLKSPSRAMTPGALALYRTDYELWIENILPSLWGNPRDAAHREQARTVMLNSIPPRNRGGSLYMADEDVRELVPCVAAPAPDSGRWSRATVSWERY